MNKQVYSAYQLLSWLSGFIPFRHDSLPCGEWTIINSHILPHTLYRGRPHVDCPGSAGTGSTVEKTSPPEQRNEPSPSGRSLTHASCSVCILLHLRGEEERGMGRGRKEEKGRGGKWSSTDAYIDICLRSTYKVKQLKNDFPWLTFSLKHCPASDACALLLGEFGHHPKPTRGGHHRLREGVATLWK